MIEDDAADAPATVTLLHDAPVGAPPELLLDPVKDPDERRVPSGVLAQRQQPLRTNRGQLIEVDAGTRERGRLRQHNPHPVFLGGGIDRQLFAEMAIVVCRRQVRHWPVHHSDEDGNVRPRLRPRLAAEGTQRRIDLARIEMDDQIVWAVARALFIVDRNARHAVVIAEAFDEICRLAFQRNNPAVVSDEWVSEVLATLAQPKYRESVRKIEDEKLGMKLFVPELAKDKRETLSVAQTKIKNHLEISMRSFSGLVKFTY